MEFPRSERGLGLTPVGNFGREVPSGCLCDASDTDPLAPYGRPRSPRFAQPLQIGRRRRWEARARWAGRMQEAPADALP